MTAIPLPTHLATQQNLRKWTAVTGWGHPRSEIPWNHLQSHLVLRVWPSGSVCKTHGVLIEQVSSKVMHRGHSVESYEFDIHPSKNNMCIQQSKHKIPVIFILEIRRVFAFQICLSKLSNLYPTLQKRTSLACYAVRIFTNRALEILTPKRPYKSHQNPTVLRAILENLLTTWSESEGPRVRFTSFSSSFRPLDLATQKAGVMYLVVFYNPGDCNTKKYAKKYG